MAGTLDANANFDVTEQYHATQTVLSGGRRLTVFSEDGKVNSSGCVDPGYPTPHGVRQAMLPLPKGTDWKGLRLKAELEVKGQRYPCRWACRQSLNADGSLTLHPTPGLG